ncbi:MAG: hypothetical protein H6760_00725 [Candidatus Nomurabacteria bacterium]|nr:MAG: hypothetical protein H6760_00725 [Candidatus Nomurabacteria bacterium]
MRRIFIIIIALVLLITIAALILIWIGGGDAFNTNENTNTTTNTSLPLANTNTTVNNNVNSSVDVSPQSTLIGQGRSFAERYASWSRADFDEYISSLSAWITPSFATVLQTDNEALDAAKTVQSVSSRVLTSSYKSWEEDSSASISFVMDRTERRDNEPDAHYYETLVLDYTFLNGEWMVNGASWQPSRVQPE